jgi:predicted O-methyltransferase YrrM
MLKDPYILLQPRMFYESAEREQNICRGLMPLIEKVLTKNSVMVEVGSFAGVSSEVFAQHVKHLHCVDLWATYYEIEDIEILREGERRFDAFASNYKNVTKIKGDSVQTASKFDNNSVDFVYLDAFHELDTVKAEIQAWLPKIKKTGYIGGHDIIMHQVRQAIIETLGDVYQSFEDTSWLVKL